MAEETAEQKAAAAEAAKAGKKELSGDEKRIADLETQNKALVKEAMEKKEHIRKLEETKAAEEEKHLKEQNKFKELYEAAVPKVERLTKLEPILNSMLETEVSEIPEDKRELIPSFSVVEEKLLWVRNAKVKGLFLPAQKVDANGKPIIEKKAPAGSIQSKTGSEENVPEFLSIPANDPRLQKLSLSDYRRWKEHNQKTPVGVRSWGG